MDFYLTFYYTLLLYNIDANYKQDFDNSKITIRYVFISDDKCLC